jgi:hypothetical protein
MAFSQADFTMSIPINTALLPINFTASQDILSELRCIPDQNVLEYSAMMCMIKITPCVSVDGSVAAWMQANPTHKWSITFTSKRTIYGTAYWVNYKPSGLLEYLRERSDEYDLLYKRNDIPIFTLRVNKFYESRRWYIRINTIWHFREELPARATIIAAEQILQDMHTIFNLHNKCAVCLDKAFLVKWPACTHAFCQDCTNAWCRERNTCPLCRASSSSY